MKLAKRREIATKRQYRFEEEAEILTSWREQLSYKELYNFACMYWCGIQRRPVVTFPLLFFGKGLKSGNRYLSYADVNHPPKIVLAKGQHDQITTLHELLHHEGLDHGQEFYVTMVNCLWKYYDFHLEGLIATGRKFKLEYR